MTRCLATLTFLAIGLTAFAAQAAEVKEMVKEMTPPSNSEQFAQKAAESGMLEVKLSQLALTKSQNTQVKQFAQRMIQDHTRANDQLTAIAKQGNFGVPNSLTGLFNDKYQAFEKLDEPAFDQNYMLFNINAHLHDIAMFENEAQSGTNPQVKAFAAQTVPILREHAAMIPPVATAVGIPINAMLGGHNSAMNGERNNEAQPAGSVQTPGSSK